ncbi:MAG: glycogen/starch/alpha-glucan phosphorylase, partial [Balneolaceae bacterium]|nr:glycogen/starch/alpha-glucan phosphorylase [Balneolaceae bacterium]
FNEGEYMDAMRRNIADENISRVLYPNDKVMLGQELRLKQEYFLVSATLQDAFRRFKKQFDDFRKIPQQMAIHCNDTHPHLAIPELMRLLMDREGLGWETSWDIVTQTVNYTNHTLMPEALEQWPLSLMKNLLPRHVQIIQEIDRRFLNSITVESTDDQVRKNRMRIVSDEMNPFVRMGNLGAVGSHKINGVSEIHSDLMKQTIFSDFYQEFPEKFTNVTNGITPRRWLRQCNAPLANLISSRIGTGWVQDLDQLQQIEPFADDPDFRGQFADIKLQKKEELAAYIKEELGVTVRTDSIFDIQIKRMHEYKRQLLAVFHAITLYNRIKANPEADHEPRTIIFGGKAAPGYTMAKLYIKFINAVGKRINRDSDVNDTLKCIFLPDYSVSLAEMMIPAADLSEQISTAGMEASGTGNMKFALNGALTIGTLDGANIEIRKRVGKENIFIFGLKVDEIEELRSSGYDPHSYLDANEELQKIIVQLSNGFFTPDEPDVFQPIINALLNDGDHYMVMADYQSYIEKQQEVEQVYRDQPEWNRRAIINMANMGHFSSDRAVQEYADKIWEI